MKIKYKNDIYQVNIKDYLLIKKEQAILTIKRLWRYFKRVYSSMQSLFIIFVFTVNVNTKMYKNGNLSMYKNGNEKCTYLFCVLV